MAETPNVSLALTNRPENVLLVRQTISGLADVAGLDPVELNDVNTAVTEACNNVVLHAYGGDEGPLEVEIFLRPQELGITVRDRGRGIGPRERPSELADGGIGLPVIHALSNAVELHDLDGGGTEVCMSFQTPGIEAVEAISENPRELEWIAGPELDDSALVAVAPTPLARAVLPRLLCSLAARAYFSTDRISDTQLLTDALLGHLDGSLSGGRLGIGIGVAARELQLQIGPLDDGHADALIEACTLDGFGSLVERLADAHSTNPANGSGEVLELRLREHG